MHVRPATAADVVPVWRLREEAARRLTASGIRQWTPGEIPLDVVAAQVAAGEWFVAEAAGGIAGALRLLWSDDETWGGHPDVALPAGYVHGLVTHPRRARPGLGAALLGWAAERVAERGADRLRLDCVEGNERLRRYYREQGFTEVGRRAFDGPWFSCVLLERPATATSGKSSSSGG